MPDGFGRTPGLKLGLALAVAFLLSFPLFAVWLLVYDRQQQSETAQASIAEGWGGPQSMAGPVLAIPYRMTTSETLTEDGRPVTRARVVERELVLAPEAAEIDTEVRPEPRRRSIYEVIIYEAAVTGRARFAMPSDLARLGIAPADLALDRAQLRFGLSDPRGLGANPHVRFNGQDQRLEPGGGGRPGFFSWVDARSLAGAPVAVDYRFSFRGNRQLGLAPQAGDTVWTLRSSWPHPSFQGSFLPASRRVGANGFEARYRVGNLALGRSLTTTRDPVAPEMARAPEPGPAPPGALEGREGRQLAEISLMEPVDLYSQVNRAAKYGFLFIGFTFLAFLLFDVVGGVRVSSVEYLLVGASLILFFVLLLAFAEVIGFTPAYLLASAAITGLNTAYSAAVLKSWRRASFIGALLASLYAVLYVLLSLEAYSLLIGSLMLFAALAGVMYLTRNLDWGRRGAAEEATAA